MINGTDSHENGILAGSTVALWMIEKESEGDDVPGPTCAKPTLQFHPRAAITAHYTPIMEIIIS